MADGTAAELVNAKLSAGIMRRIVIPSFLRLQPEEHVQRFPAGLEKPQGLDKGDELLVAEVPDVEIRELFSKQVPQKAGADPAVVIRILFTDRDQSGADRLQADARLGLFL